jgi:ribonuclease HI
MLLYIYTDGASRSNPGKSASGYMICDSDGNPLLEKSFYNGIRTNNEAEYLAVVAALESVAEAYGYNVELELYSDSRLIINQLAGTFKIKSGSLAPINKAIKEQLAKFNRYALHNVPRENRFISRVDKSLNELLDKYQ